jgi:hypothetical protein
MPNDILLDLLRRYPSWQARREVIGEARLVLGGPLAPTLDGQEEAILVNLRENNRSTKLVDDRCHGVTNEPRQEERTSPEVACAPRFADKALHRSDREMKDLLAGQPLWDEPCERPT